MLLCLLFCLLGVSPLVGCGPIGPFPGGSLSGEPGPSVVEDWSFVEDVQTAQLETAPDDPHSVNTWFVAVGPALYVPTSMIFGPRSPTERGWVQRVNRDPRVRIRVRDRVYERLAILVEDEGEDRDEYDRARAALEAKYELDPADRDPDRTIWIYRLDARVGS